MYNLTPRQFENKLTGFEQLETQRDRIQWEKFRLLAATLLTPHTKNAKGVQPHKLWPFKWDKKEITPKMTPERMAYISKRSKLLRHG